MAEPLTIMDIAGYDTKMGVEVAKITSAVNAGEVSAAEATMFFETISGQRMKPVRAFNGDILSWVVDESATVSHSNPINSNAGTLSRGTLSSPISTTVTQAGKATTSRLAGIGTKAATLAGKVAVPLTLASIGITLGKTIDETLYNFNPDYWDSIGMSTLDPQKWSSLVGGDGTVAGSFFNAIFGIDPATGNSQAYVDADVLAYAAYCMQSSGMFDTGEETITEIAVSGRTYNSPLYKIPFNCSTQVVTGGSTQYTYYADPSIIIGYHNITGGSAPQYLSATQPCSGYLLKYPLGSSYRCQVSIAGDYPSTKFNRVYYDGTQYKRVSTGDNSFVGEISGNYYTASNFTISDVAVFNTIPVESSAAQNTGNNYLISDMSYLLVYGEYEGGEAVPGIGNQTGATIPDFSNLSDESQYLPYLQQTYPDMFTNSLSYPVMQDDGTVRNKTYIPITLPDTSQVTGTEPTSGDQTQANPEINPYTSSDTLIELLTKLLQQPDTEEATDDITPPENPTDTGEGSSPVPVVPVGSASSLWKIYHPTQAQVDAFGGWLWSSDFIDQILKIFNNPMEAIIGLHKVYATPIDAGNTTIKVGYLDSEVPSAYIEQQYITIDCGSVNLFEQFGNVFDYSPFTDVQLYLPFVGIVPLNVSDVMRATISIKYGVDVITGACLAQVKVTRDANSSILYQYSGNCAVQYPISSGSYMGIVSSIISVAGGVAATVASGGAVAPLALGAAGGLLNAHTNVQHSGGFSGNAGAMGCKIPYLIINRPQTKVAMNAETMQGYSSNSYTTIGECSGYIKADSVHVINVNATDEEMTEINNLILSGIII